jgi:monovalent cation:H+ antiporter-2, CPA2 family
MVDQAHDVSQVFIELGVVIVGLALLARFANRLGFSAIPLYLLAGLAFGNGGLVPLNVSENFTQIGAEIGVLLLLFMLGLEYTGEDLKENLRTGFSSGVADFALNFPPGLITGLLLRWDPIIFSVFIAIVTVVVALVTRGEFSIVIAGLGARIEPQLGPLAAAYVLFLAVLGPVLARLAK